MECKTKVGSLISKRSVPIPKLLAEQLIAGDPAGLERTRSGLLQDLFREMTLHLLRPVVLVDVRTLDEYRTGHKEGALNIPADEVEQLAPRLLPDKNAVIMLYCRTGKRADKALEALRKMGYSHVENLHRFEM